MGFPYTITPWAHADCPMLPAGCRRKSICSFSCHITSLQSYLEQYHSIQLVSEGFLMRKSNLVITYSASIVFIWASNKTKMVYKKKKLCLGYKKRHLVIENPKLFLPMCFDQTAVCQSIWHCRNVNSLITIGNNQRTGFPTFLVNKI